MFKYLNQFFKFYYIYSKLPHANHSHLLPWVLSYAISGSILVGYGLSENGTVGFIIGE
jgi:hypothetical protein